MSVVKLCRAIEVGESGNFSKRTFLVIIRVDKVRPFHGKTQLMFLCKGHKVKILRSRYASESD